MSDRPAPTHTGSCVQSLDGDGEPLGYCVGCYQDMHAAPEPCPECRVGKHGNCDGDTYDDLADCHPCPCAEAGHE